MAAHHLLFLTLIIFAISGYFEAHAVVPYDHSFTSECLVKPWAPQYGGGIVTNPEFNDLQSSPPPTPSSVGWEQHPGKTEFRTSADGANNNYFVAYVDGNRTSNLATFNLEKDKLYAFSVWVQLKQGRNSYVKAIFRSAAEETTTTTGGIIKYTAGAVAAKEGCWSMLKGGLPLLNSSAAYSLSFEIIHDHHNNSNNNIPITTEIWIDSVSLYPFTKKEWKSHRDTSLNKTRKTQVTFQAQAPLMVNATISVKQVAPHFPFGCAINQFILQNKAYADWFLSRGFTHTVFENELKWTTTNPLSRADPSNYTLPDALLQFTKRHSLTPRAHTVLWGSNTANPAWFNTLPLSNKTAIQEAADARVDSVMNRYKGQFFQWDIINENMHNTYLDDVLGPDASTKFYQRAHRIEPDALIFLNEYHTIERADDEEATPWHYLERIKLMRAQGYTGPLGIGLQAHFSGFNSINLAFVRASLDVLASAKLPIWITELDVSGPSPNQARYFEEFLRELHAHEAVQGIILWGGWWPNGGCYKMCLTDDDFNNLPAGDVLDKIMGEWTYNNNNNGKKKKQKQKQGGGGGGGGVQVGTTNAGGEYTTGLFHGEYEATITHPALQRPMVQRFKLVPQQGHLNVTFNINLINNEL